MLRVRVTRKEQIATDIQLFEFSGVAGAELPAFSAGSHIDVHAPAGHVRQYSLCNHPRERHRYQVAVLRAAEGRGGSESMHSDVRVGDEVAIGEPRNHFALAPHAQESLLFAGGIGITPLLCMAEQLASTGQRFRLHYCSRTRVRTAFLDRIAESSLASNVALHFDDGPASQRIDLDALLQAPREGLHLYTCGPNGFMDAVLKTARQHGWNEEHLHFEFFAGASDATKPGGAFEVRIASSGNVYLVPEDQTIAAVLAQHGIPLATSCEQGICGTCLTRVLAGEPDHRDLYLTDAEKAAGDQLLPCCSRSKSAILVLDL